jgi:hypothetical protein
MIEPLGDLKALCDEGLSEVTRISGLRDAPVDQLEEGEHL